MGRRRSAEAIHGDVRQFSLNCSESDFSQYSGLVFCSMCGIVRDKKMHPVAEVLAGMHISLIQKDSTGDKTEVATAVWPILGSTASFLKDRPRKRHLILIEVCLGTFFPFFRYGFKECSNFGLLNGTPTSTYHMHFTLLYFDRVLFFLYGSRVSSMSCCSFHHGSCGHRF